MIDNAIGDDRNVFAVGAGKRKRIRAFGNLGEENE
jgi:hypothetical protein